MKQNIICIAVIICIAISFPLNCGWKPGQKELLGTWKGRFHGTEFILIFKDEKTILMKVKDLSVSGAYKADFSQTPIRIELTNEHGVTERTIFEFLDPEHIRFQSGGPDGEYPEGFSAEQSFILRRIEE